MHVRTPVALVCLFASLFLAAGKPELAAACVGDLELLLAGLDPGAVAEIGRSRRRAGPDAS